MHARRVVLLTSGENVLPDALPRVHKIDLVWFRASTAAAAYELRLDASNATLAFPVLTKNGYSYNASEDYALSSEVKPQVMRLTRLPASLWTVDGDPLPNAVFEAAVCVHYEVGNCTDPSESGLPNAESGIRQEYVVVRASGSARFAAMHNITSLKLLDSFLEGLSPSEPYHRVEIPELREAFYVPSGFETIPGSLAEFAPPRWSFASGFSPRFYDGTGAEVLPTGYALLFDVHYVPRKEETPYATTSHDCTRLVVDSRDARASGTHVDFTFDLSEDVFRNVSRVSLAFASLPKNGEPYARLRIAEVECCWTLPYETDGSNRAVLCPTVQTKSLNPPKNLVRLTVQLLGAGYDPSVPTVLFLDLSHDPRRTGFDPHCKSAYA
jgi:hypothetical protein